MNNNNIGCLTIIFLAAIAIVISLGVSGLATYLIIWAIKGLFNYDLSDKFWYIFVLICVVIPCLKGIFSISTKGN